MNAREPDHFRVQGPIPARDARPAPAIYELSVENARELDRRAVEEYAMDSIVLMENAAFGLCTHVLDMLCDVTDPSVVICAGPGNNGGDGFALARHLHNHQIPTRVVRTIDADGYAGDAGKNLRIIERMGIETMGLDAFLETPSHPNVPLIVDALFGTGLGRAIEGRVGELVTWINTTKSRVGSRVLAVDTPSGLDAQSGQPLGSFVVRADRTVTFAGLKPGMARMEALEFLGEVHVAPIGVPLELLERLGHRIESRNPR